MHSWNRRIPISVPARRCSSASAVSSAIATDARPVATSASLRLRIEAPREVTGEGFRGTATLGGPELWVTGSQDRPVDVTIFTVRTDTHRDLDDPISCAISPIERISSRSIPGQIKVSGAYVNSFHARRTAEQAGFSDGLMFDREGHLAEASAANVFLIERGRLITPRLKPDVFPGITRAVILELVRGLGIEVEELEIDRMRLAAVQGAFVCSTLMEIRGLDRLGERKLPTVELAQFRSVVREFRALTHS